MATLGRFGQISIFRYKYLNEKENMKKLYKNTKPTHNKNCTDEVNQ